MRLVGRKDLLESCINYVFIRASTQRKELFKNVVWAKLEKSYNQTERSMVFWFSEDTSSGECGMAYSKLDARLSA